MTIDEACKQSWDESWISKTLNSDNCSGFVKSVMKNMGLSPPEKDADGLMEYFATTWTAVASAADAVSAVREGKYLVVAGMRIANYSLVDSKGNSKAPPSQAHVVVIIDGNLQPRGSGNTGGTYPYCWSGSTGSAKSKGDKTVGDIFAVMDRNNVKYYKKLIA